MKKMKLNAGVLKTAMSDKYMTTRCHQIVSEIDTYLYNIRIGLRQLILYRHTHVNNVPISIIVP